MRIWLNIDSTSVWCTVFNTKYCDECVHVPVCLSVSLLACFKNGTSKLHIFSVLVSCKQYVMYFWFCGCAFSALTLLVGRQEQRSACKN